MRNETNAGHCCWEPSETGWGEDEEVRELLFVFRDVLSLTERSLPAPTSALQAVLSCFRSFVTASFYSSCFSLRPI